MATWITYPKVEKFPAVLRQYKRPRQFYDAVRAEVLGSAVWARRSTATVPNAPACWQVNVEAITGVRPLTAAGTLKS